MEPTSTRDGCTPANVSDLFTRQLNVNYVLQTFDGLLPRSGWIAELLCAYAIGIQAPQ